jgi:hypothetical protein
MTHIEATTKEISEFLQAAADKLDAVGKVRTLTNLTNQSFGVTNINAKEAYYTHSFKSVRRYLKVFYSDSSTMHWTMFHRFSNEQIAKYVVDVSNMIASFRTIDNKIFEDVFSALPAGNPITKKLATLQPVAPKAMRMSRPKVNVDLNEDVQKAISEIVDARLKLLRPNQIIVNGAAPVKIEGRVHVAFKECLKLIMIEKQLFISGPAGTGKTTLASQLATALKVRYGFISCTAGMSEAHLLGRMTADGSYVSTSFIECYENGGVFLFDEVDAADPNTMLIINSALANGNLSVPNRQTRPQANRHEEFYCVCAANTWGTGSNEYAGRNILDAAFLDRFTGSRLEVGYDTSLEKEIGAEYPQVYNTIWTIRKNVQDSRIRRVVSTRAIVSGVRAMKAGYTLKEYISRFMTGWTKEEQAKATMGVAL